MAEGISTRVARKLKQALGGSEVRTGVTEGTATVAATEGGVWLSIPGSDAPTPVNGNVTCDVAKGDVVGYRIEDGRLSVTGSVSKPSIGETRAAGFVEPVAEAVEELRQETVAAAARTNRVVERSRVIAGIANAAKSVADATNQHFFADDNGVHVTEKEQTDWEQAHEGANMLLNSIGQLFRDGLTNLISITTQAGARAITFWDGEGNDAGNVTASFGADGAQIGKSDESHMALDYHSLQMVDMERHTYFHVSDLRDENGTATLTETFRGDGITKSFTVGIAVSEEVSATDSSDPSNTATRSNHTYTFASAPASNATVTIVYKTTSGEAKAYTIGSRLVNYGVGGFSVAAGSYVVASGIYSHAVNTGTVASGYASHAEGMRTTASGYISHAEGGNTTASGYESHAEGANATASAYASHAEGAYTVASGQGSHAQNNRTIAAYNYQTAIGKFNDNDYANAFEIGNGTADDARSNAFAVDWSGNVEAAGTVAATLQEDIVTASTDVTPTGVNHCWHNGVVCTVSLGYNLVSTLANGGTVTVGTVPVGFRPPYTVYGSVYNNTPGGVGVRGYLTTAGNIVVRNLSGGPLDSTANLYVSFTFAM